MISVVVASFNGAKYIEEQILSILNQSEKVDEIIVSDDCSSDETIGIIGKIQEMSGNSVVKVRQNQKIRAIFGTFIMGLVRLGAITFSCRTKMIYGKKTR